MAHHISPKDELERLSTSLPLRILLLHPFFILPIPLLLLIADVFDPPGAALAIADLASSGRNVRVVLERRFAGFFRRASDARAVAVVGCCCFGDEFGVSLGVVGGGCAVGRGGEGSAGIRGSVVGVAGLLVGHRA
jgi:hypothetical protein